LPRRLPTRSISVAICAFDATMALKVSAIFPSSPVQCPGRRNEKSPSRTACRPVRSSCSFDGGIGVGRTSSSRASGVAVSVLGMEDSRNVRSLCASAGSVEKADHEVAVDERRCA
jgi:hypothetical protein